MATAKVAKDLSVLSLQEGSEGLMTSSEGREEGSIGEVLFPGEPFGEQRLEAGREKTEEEGWLLIY